MVQAQRRNKTNPKTEVKATKEVEIEPKPANFAVLESKCDTGTQNIWSTIKAGMGPKSNIA